MPRVKADKEKTAAEQPFPSLRGQMEVTESRPTASEGITVIQASDISATSSSGMNGEESGPAFDALTAEQASGKSQEMRRIPVPSHRLTPLKNAWKSVYEPLVEHMKLQVRMNLKLRAVEIRTSPSTTDSGALQKGADFIKAFLLGFEPGDAIALLRLDDLFLESFEIKDVKPLHGDHLSRAIGRIAGKDGKTKFAIENSTRTRMVLADTRIHILGSFNNIKIARDAVCSLILGAPPGKVYSKLRTVASRLKERF